MMFSKKKKKSSEGLQRGGRVEMAGRGGCRDKSALCSAHVLSLFIPPLPSREPAHGTKALCSAIHKEPFKHFSTAREYPSNQPLNCATKRN